ncbi:hypothetical protein [Ktedonospora formicarum]|uniref:Uncharacterized protein n=1 Tax=Ktedonospora formicarum TaxID=2778364 RepID=A0A8J3I190_9CHLR|nr:hypothetical protein [Ktedonospora formicarum]GHO44208.1 hypothetical protein KSX_23710 [Ktedonospora formicarum]
MLIIGGLIIVAVLAILGAFLMARGGGNSDATAAPATTAVEPQASATPSQPLVTETPTSEEQTIYTGTQSPRSLPTDAPYGDMMGASLPLYALRQEIHMLQGQVYQLSEHIQVLNQHAHEIEQRLSRVHELLPEKGREDHAGVTGSPNAYNEGHSY